MDLEAGERILAALEDEAGRVKGLANLREELHLGLKASRESISNLRLAAEKLERASAQTEANRTRLAEDILRAVQALQDKICEVSENLDQGLRNQADQVDEHLNIQAKTISSGLAEIHSQIKIQVVEIDRTVKAELAQTLGAFRSELNNLATAISRSIALSHRELGQTITAARDEQTQTIKGLGDHLRNRLRLDAVAFAILVIGNAIVLWQLLTMMHK